MDRSVHLRPGWGLGLSLSSSRIYNYESINGENLHGWFTGDGVTYVYNNDLSQLSDDFWATVDPYALPGTTVETTPRANGAGQSYLSSKPWVGGATLFTNGAAGMDLNPYSSPLSGKKSWFMFQDGVACLGAGINCANGATVQTTVENRKLSLANTNVFTADGQDLPTTLGWSTNLSGSTWCALAGAGGYYFPGTANLSVLRQARTNSWSQINTGGSTNLTARNYLTLWFNHGVQPTNATYAYVLLPNSSTAQMASYAANPNLLVLENSTNAQAVKVSSSGIVAANFWNDAPWTVDLISCNRKASIVTQQTPLNLWVAVSDPTQLNSSNMVVSLNQPANSVAFLDPAIVVSQVRPTIQMTVNVKGASGRSLTAGFNLQNSPPWLAPIANHTINPGSTLTLTNTATDSDLPYQTLTFGLLNPPAGAAITTINITNGLFTWRPAITQAGTTNVIAVTVTDNGSPSMSATQTFVVTVTQPPAPGLALIPATTGQFAFSVSGTAGPDYLIQASTNLINWTTLYATSSPALPFVWVDSQRTLFPRRFYRALLGPASPSFPPIPNHVVSAGLTLSLSSQATDPNLPPQALFFSLLAGPTNATVNPTNGAFVWRPSVAQAGTSNTVTILASNTGDTRLNATQTFGITVNPMSPPTLSQLSLSNGRPTFSILGDIGPDYSVQASTNLHDWGTLFTTNSPVLPFFWTDQTATNFRARFYRALVGP
jgi:hypothetical protein